MKAPKIVAACCLSVLIALYVVGAVSIPPGSLRHEVQTLALWAPIIVGFNRHDIAKWMAMPLLAFWLLIMIAIWLFLLGWARIVTGHFFPTEIAMTIVVGIASFVGLVSAARWRTGTAWGAAFGTMFVFLLLQLAVFRVSLIPYVGRR